MARKLQEEEEESIAKLKKEKSQLQKDEELAKKLHAQEMAELAKEEAAAKAKQLRSKKAAKNPSKAQVARDKRRMIVTFLKSTLNVSVQRLQKMNEKALEELYNKEKKTLQGDSKKGVEEEIDEAQIDQIRKDTEVAQPRREGMENVQQVTAPAKKGIKRMKMKASKPGPHSKKLKRTEEAEIEKVQEEEKIEKEAAKKGEEEHNQEAQPHGESSTATDVESLQGLIIHTDDQEKVVDAVPLQSKPPQIVDWFITDEGLRKVYTFFRANKSFFSYSTFLRVMKIISRDDLDDIIRIGVQKYVVLDDIDNLMMKMAMEHLHVLLDTEVGKQLRERRPDALTRVWELFENCGV